MDLKSEIEALKKEVEEAQRMKNFYKILHDNKSKQLKQLEELMKESDDSQPVQDIH